MQRRTVFAVALAAVLVGIVGWNAWAPASGVAPGTASRHDTAASAVVGAPRDGERGAASPSLAREQGVPVAQPALVRIVDESGAPVAGAEVAFDASVELVDVPPPLPFDVEQRLPNALRVRSGEDGVARLASDATRARVIARHGERFGQQVIEFADPWCDVPELSIAPDRNLDILVIGPHGEPRANVPVDADFQEYEGRVDDGMRTRELPFSDANGRVMLWHAQTLPFWPGSEPAVTLRAVVLGAPSTDVRVVLATPIPEPVRVPCAPHGAIRVRAWIAPGLPNSGPLVPVVLHERWSRRLVVPGSSPAEPLLAPLALQLWKVSGQYFGCASWQLTRDREVASVDLLPDEGTYATVVKLRGPDGSVAANESIRVSRCDEEEGRTDSEGVLRFLLDANGGTLFAPARNASAEIYFGEREPDAHGIIDLGVVQLLAAEQQSNPLFATCRVVDARTGRCVDASVWDVVAGRYTPSVAGLFAIHATSTEPIAVSFTARAYYGCEWVLNPGDRDVVVPMQRMPRLHATVLFDADVPDGCVHVRMRYEEGPTQLWDAEHTVRTPGRLDAWLDWYGNEVQVDGSLFRGCIPREYPIGCGPLPLARVARDQWRVDGQDFAVTIDLRGTTELIWLSCKPCPPGNTFLRSPGTSAAWGVRRLDGPEAFVVPRGTRLEVIAVPSSAMVAKAVLVPGHNEMVFAPTAIVKFEVEADKETRRLVEVRLYQLARREPLLDELAERGVVGYERPVLDWPVTEDQLGACWHLDANATVWYGGRSGPEVVEVSQRGRYIAIPYVERVPVFEAAVPVEVTAPGESIQATIRLDADRVRAAQRAHERR